MLIMTLVGKQGFFKTTEGTLFTAVYRIFHRELGLDYNIREIALTVGCCANDAESEYGFYSLFLSVKVLRICHHLPKN